MNNFTFQNSTKIMFGKDMEQKIGLETHRHSQKVLLIYGSGSIKRSGLYDRIVSSLEEQEIDFVELSGVQPNPRVSLVRQGIQLCRKHRLDFVLAVGGGSVIDSAKGIAMGVLYQGDVWDFYEGKAQISKTLPVGVVLTIPAAGSESSTSSVLTNEDGWYKRGTGSELIRPKFAILNPMLTYTLPPYQTACGAADIMAHVMERYFTNTQDVDFTDRLCEATLKAIIANVPIALKEPENYAARAEVMWAGTIAHNDLLGTGRDQDWASHGIEHELSAIYDVAHGAGLAVIFPAWMKYVYKQDVKRFVQFAVRVWNVDDNFHNPERIALEGIERMEQFFKKAGLPVTLKELGITDNRIEEMADKCTTGNTRQLGGFMKLKKQDIIEIYRLAKE